MADRKRIRPKETMWDILLRLNKRQAERLLDQEDHDEDSYVEANDLLVDCQECVAFRADETSAPAPDWIGELERLVEDLEREFGDVVIVDPWVAFLDEHPELTVQPATLAPVLPRLELDDERVTAAVEEAFSQSEIRRHPKSSPGVRAATVATVLRGGNVYAANPPEHQSTQSDCVRVGQTLARLGREGKIAVVNLPYEGPRYVPLEAADAG